MKTLTGKLFARARFAFLAVLPLVAMPDGNAADFQIDVDALEHPYILFRKEDIPRLRERTQTYPYRYIWERVTATPPEKAGAAVNAFIYAITGEVERGHLARESLKTALDSLPLNGGKKPKLGVAFGTGGAGLIYDLIYDLLSEEERRDLSARLIRDGIRPLYNHTWISWWGTRRQHNYSPQFNAQCGIISAPKFFGNHEHADRGSIILNAYGKRLIIDAGKPFSYGDPIIDTWFRGSAGHNLLHVDGEGQTSQNQLSAPGRMRDFITTPVFDYVLTENAGPYAGRVGRWDRHALFAVPEFVILFDQVKLPRPGEVEFRYLSPGSSRILLEEENTALFPGSSGVPSSGAGNRIAVRVGGASYQDTDWWRTGQPLPEMTEWTDEEMGGTDLLLRSFFITGSPDEGGGADVKREVLSGYQDYRLPATYLTQSHPDVSQASVITVLYPRSAAMKEQQQLPQITDLSDAASIGLKIERDQRQHLILARRHDDAFKYNISGDFARPNASVEQLSSNADLAAVAFSAGGGGLDGYIMIHGTELTVKGDTSAGIGPAVALHADLPLSAVAFFQEDDHDGDGKQVCIVLEVPSPSGADLRLHLPTSPRSVAVDGRAVAADMTRCHFGGHQQNSAKFHIPAGRSEVTIICESDRE